MILSSRNAMLKKAGIFLVAVIVVGSLVLLSYKTHRNRSVFDSSSSKLKIVVSFYPLAEFVRQVGGAGVDVIMIIPAGAEPHEYEPTPKDIAAISSAKLFLYQGGGFDRWAEQTAKTARMSGVMAVPIADSFTLKDGNPHIWLDPVLVEKEIEIIRDSLASVDPQNTDLYHQNAMRFIGLLVSLDEKYKNGLADCASREVMAPHPAFQYLADRYGLFLTAIEMLPEQELSLRRMAEVIQMVRAKNIKYIFTEPLVGSKAADTIARETGAEILTLNPIEGLADADIAARKDYISLMIDNLQNLRVALQCK